MCLPSLYFLLKSVYHWKQGFLDLSKEQRVTKWVQGFSNLLEATIDYKPHFEIRIYVLPLKQHKQDQTVVNCFVIHQQAL